MGIPAVRPPVYFAEMSFRVRTAAPTAFQRTTFHRCQCYRQHCQTELERRLGQRRKKRRVVQRRAGPDEPFAWHGRHFSFPNVAVWPRPRQTPRPFVFGSGNNEGSAIFAARQRIGMALSFLPLEAEPRFLRRATDNEREPQRLAAVGIVFHNKYVATFVRRPRGFL